MQIFFPERTEQIVVQFYLFNLCRVRFRRGYVVRQIQHCTHIQLELRRGKINGTAGAVKGIDIGVSPARYPLCKRPVCSVLQKFRKDIPFPLQKNLHLVQPAPRKDVRIGFMVRIRFALFRLRIGTQNQFIAIEAIPAPTQKQAKILAIHRKREDVLHRHDDFFELAVQHDPVRFKKILGCFLSFHASSPFALQDKFSIIIPHFPIIVNKIAGHIRKKNRIKL